MTATPSVTAPARPPPNVKLKPGQIKIPPWQTVPLIRSDLFDSAMFAERNRKAREERLLRLYRDGGRLSAQDQTEVQAIIARHREEARARGVEA